MYEILSAITGRADWIWRLHRTGAGANFSFISCIMVQYICCLVGGLFNLDFWPQCLLRLDQSLQVGTTPIIVPSHNHFILCSQSQYLFYPFLCSGTSHSTRRWKFCQTPWAGFLCTTHKGLSKRTSKKYFIFKLVSYLMSIKYADQ